jgi:hypothetical protein
MPVATVLEFPGVTQELYDAVGASLGAAGPTGILYHACGPTEDGWRIADIWTSEEAWDRFLDGVYLPAMRACGGPEPSRREAIPTYHAGPVQRRSVDG